MLGHRHDIARPGAAKEVSPGCGVKIGPGEIGDKVLIAKFAVRAIGFEMVGIFRLMRQVHIAWIPFVAKGWHAVDAPVDKDAKLGVLIPGGRGVRGQRFPGGRKGASVHDLVNGGESAGNTRRNRCGQVRFRSSGMMPLIAVKGA